MLKQAFICNASEILSLFKNNNNKTKQQQRTCKTDILKNKENKIAGIPLRNGSGVERTGTD